MFPACQEDLGTQKKQPWAIELIHILITLEKRGGKIRK
jgi:hypothetical protein